MYFVEVDVVIHHGVFVAEGATPERVLEEAEELVKEELIACEFVTEEDDGRLVTNDSLQGEVKIKPRTIQLAS